MAQERHTAKDKALKLTRDIVVIIDEYIRTDWSPEQIAHYRFTP